MRLPIKAKITVASVVTLAVVAWLIAFVLQAQESLAELMDEMIEKNMSVMRTAEQIKYNFVLHDDLVFRYLATDDKSLLAESERVREKVHAWVDEMKASSNGKTERELLRDLEEETAHYERDVQMLMETYKFNTAAQKKSVLDLVKAVESGASTPKPVQQDRKTALALLSAEGRARLTRIYSLCEKLVDIARAKLEDAQSRVHGTVAKTRRTALVAGGGVLGAVVLVALILAISLLTPIQNLLKGVQKVTAGELDMQLPVEGSDEVGRLTVEFNTMTRNLREKQERLVTETITDPLTELHNFRYFQTQLKSEITRAARYNHPLSLLIVDIDHFKHYNDTNGHQMGNVILKQVAQAMKDTLRGEDFLARYGGEEFVAVLTETDPAKGRAVAERLRASIESLDVPGRDKQPGGKLTVSIGGASFPGNGNVASVLIERADKSLYTAKKGGRNQVSWAL